MSEEAGFESGILVQDGIDFEGRNERESSERSVRKPRNKEEGVLFDLAERYEWESTPLISFTEAISLIDAVVQDKEDERARPLAEHERPNIDVLEQPVPLEFTKNALLKAREGEDEYTRAELRIARAYFRWKTDYWTENNEDLPIEFADKLRRVYGGVLRQLNEKMPVPESVLPVPPSEPGFISTATILDPLFNEDPATGEATVKETLKTQDVLDTFKAMQEDIELQKPPENVMHTAVVKGLEYFGKEHAQWNAEYEEKNADWEKERARILKEEQRDIGPYPPFDAICVAVLGSDGQFVAIEPYQKGKKYTQRTREDGSQFLLDMTTQHPFTNDNEFARRVVLYDDLRASAGRAIPAIQMLFENPSQIGAHEFEDIRVGVMRLVKFVDPEDQIQRDAVEKLVEKVSEKLAETSMIIPPEPAPFDEEN